MQFVFLGDRNDPGDLRRQLKHRHVLGVAHHRHHKAARRGGGNAEVDVVTEDDLVSGVIPCGVDDGGAPHRQAHRLAPHRQRGDTQAFETTVGTQPVDQLHRRGDVAGKEGRHEGLRIQGILHGLRCDLAHPTHWHLAGVAVGLGRGATEETSRHHRQARQLGVARTSTAVPGCSSAMMSGRFDVTPRHCTLRTGAGHLE